jgi:hypothetical protein
MQRAGVLGLQPQNAATARFGIRRAARFVEG